MSNAVENLMEAQKFAMSNRPKVGGFPYLAEAMRQAGVTRNLWSLPSCQAIFLTTRGQVVSQMAPLLTGMVDIPAFDRGALIRALRVDQAGETTFPEFLKATWDAGVVSYDVNLEKRNVTYYGALGESYVEDYPAVEVHRSKGPSSSDAR